MFELTTPWIFILLPIPFFIGYFYPKARTQPSYALKVPFFSSLVKIAEQGKSHLHRSSQFSLFFLVWSLLLLALANPRWVGEPISFTRNGHHIMLALDLSPSMGIEDMSLNGQPVSRLHIVKRAAKEFVLNRINDNIGLILFGERAYLQTPFTFDTQSILLRLEDATAGLAGKSTSLGDAIGLAIKHLQNVPKKGRIIIVLTDGVSNSGVLTPLKAAEMAQADGIKIYTIGLGTQLPSSGLNQLLLSLNSSADLDEDTLKSIARLTGGRYFRAKNLESLQAVYKAINAMETTAQDASYVRPRKDYYPWPLSGAVLLLLYIMARHCNFSLKARSSNG